ncbi:hypothetical protein PVAP13_3NG176786 [Panicum virgatum]|uniref:Uncharacterized protein n=1 Tax=Panicum virgatum TaxID=38727 RepID=A0A8T0U4Y8_PANVG|nr:hypothetical protein PVAP13_3NG176786 [Panicum virgatum]
MGSMDSSADKLLQRPPPQTAKLPAPAPPEGSGGRLLGKMSGDRLRAVAAMLLVSNYFMTVSRIFAEASYGDDAPGAPLPWRLPAALALAYAAGAAAFWFVGRLERRRLPDGHAGAARWENGMKVAARVLAHAIVGVLVGYSASVTPIALYVFMWAGSSRDHIYLALEVHKEEGDEEKPYEESV